jgi:hypothetical protein
MAKCLASSQSEHGWRAPLNGLSRNGWNVLDRTFLRTAVPSGVIPTQLYGILDHLVTLWVLKSCAVMKT